MKWLAGLTALTLAAALLIGGSPAGAQFVNPDAGLLRFLPEDAGGVLFADLTQLRDVGFVRGFVADQAGVEIPGSVEDFTAATGVDPFNDVQQVMVGRSGPDEFLSVVRASIDTGRMKQFFESQGAVSETYASTPLYLPQADNDWAVAFPVEDIAVLGPPDAVRSALDRVAAGPSAMDNPELMAEIAAIEDGNQVWGVGSFADLMPDGLAPPVATDLIAALEKVRYQVRIDAGVTARLAGTFATPDTASRAGDLLRGFVALGKLGSAEQPDLIELLNGFVIQNGENSVEIRFAASQELLDRIAESGILDRAIEIE